MCNCISVVYTIVVIINSKISRWGNSLGIRIPKQLAEEVSLTEGDYIEIYCKDNQLIIKPQKIQYTLEQLLEGMSAEHLHGEIDWGEAEGNEIW